MTIRRAGRRAALHNDYMTRVSPIFHEHTRLAEALGRVRETARTIRDGGVLDPDGFREVCRFIDDVAIPHLRHEEQEVFPAAAERGMPPEALELLRRDHEQLRVLSRLVAALGLRPTSEVLPLDAAAAIERFVRAFDEHASHEEAMFRELDSGLREAV